MDKQSIIQQLKQIKPLLLEKYGVTEVALFGSYSRNEQNDKSDIDLMVNVQTPIGMKFFDMVYDFEDVFKEMKIQIVSKSGIKPKYFERIKKDLLYA